MEIVASRVRALPRPARVAVDGVTAAGKSTFADELVALAGGGRITIDDFHRPPPQEYYPSSFDFERFRTCSHATACSSSTASSCTTPTCATSGT